MRAAGERPQPPLLPGLLEERDAGAQETMAFLLRLRARGIAHVGVLRALETVPRLAFVSHRYADLALRDMALPISCGQTIPEPYLAARTLEALDLEPNHKVLEIGTGSGYSTALLARLAGEVTSYERFQTLTVEARIRLARIGVTNVTLVWGDGLAAPDAIGLYDRILVDGLVSPEIVARFLERLAEEGVLVAATSGGDGGPRLMRMRHVHGDFVHDDLGVCRSAPLVAGTALVL